MKNVENVDSRLKKKVVERRLSFFSCETINWKKMSGLRGDALSTEPVAVNRALKQREWGEKRGNKRICKDGD